MHRTELTKVFTPPLSKQLQEIYIGFLEMNQPFLDFIQMEMQNIDEETHIKENCFMVEKPQNIEEIKLFMFQKTQASLPVKGKVTSLYVKDKFTLIGSSEGQILIFGHIQNQIQSIQIISPSDQGVNIFKSMTGLIPIGQSQHTNAPKKSMLSNIVDMTYEKKKQSISEQKDYSVCAMALSDDNTIIVLANNLGEVHLYKNQGNFSSLEVIEFQKPQKFLCFYAQNHDEGAMRMIENKVYDYYELLCGDEYGNVHKVYIDMFKLLDTRTMKYTTFMIYQQSISPEQFQNTRRTWWEKKSDELQVEQNLKVVLFDVKNFFDSSNQVYQFIMFLFESRFEIVKIYLGKKIPEKKTSFIESIFYFERPFTELLIKRYNQQHKTSESNIISLSFKGSKIALGKGKLRDFNQQKGQISRAELPSEDIFSINWGSTFCLFNYQITNETIKVQNGPCSLFSQVLGKYTDANEHTGELPSVYQVEFIADNCLWVLMSDYYGAILHMDDFQIPIQQLLDLIQTPITRLTREQINQYVIVKELENHLNNYQLLTSIQSQEEDKIKKLYFIDYNQSLLKAYLIDWQQYLVERMLQNNWSIAISEAFQIRNRELKNLSLIPSIQSQLENEIKEFAPEMVKKYIQYLLKQKTVEKQQSVLQYMNFYIDYLLFTKNGDFFFDQVRQVLCDNKLQTVFYEILKDYLSQGKIKYIPTDSLLIIYQYLRRINDQKTILQLLQHLDPKRNQKLFLIKMCEEQNLKGYLIYVCNENNDYITPIQKLLPLDIDEQTAKEPNVKGIIQYIMMCLRREKINGKMIQDGIDYWTAIKNIISYLYIPDHLRIFLKIDPFYGLNVNYLFFSRNLVDIIQSQNKYIEITLTKQQIDYASTILADIQSLQQYVLNKVFILIVAIYEEMMVQDPVLFNPLYYFLFILKCALAKTFKLQKEFHFKALKFLIDQYDKLIELQDKDKQLFKTSTENFWVGVNQFLVYQINLYLESFVSSSELLQLIIISETKFSIRNFSLLLSYLYCLNSQQQKCFDQFLVIQIPILRNQVFQWLKAYFTVREPKTVPDESITNGVKILLKVNKQLTYNLVETTLNCKQSLIIDSLDSDETAVEFLQYLTHLFDNNDKDVVISDQTKIRYLKYMCLQRPKEVLTILKNYNFPLTSCLSVCQEHNVFDACVYILAELGDQKASLEYLTLIFLVKVRKQIRHILQNSHINMKKNAVLNDLFYNIIEVCKKTQEEYQETNGLWYFFLEYFFQENKIKIFTLQTVPKTVKQYLSHYISEFFIAMAYSMSPKGLLLILENQYAELPLLTFGQTFMTSQFIVQYDQDSSYFGKRIIEEQNASFNDNMFFLMNRGMFLNGRCSQCRQSLSDEHTSIIFLCAHIYHRRCCAQGMMDIPYCRICFYYLRYQIMYEKTFTQFSKNKKIYEPEKLKKQVQHFEYKFQEQEGVKKDTKERKRLLQIFDENRNFQQQEFYRSINPKILMKYGN